jgi:hypothetical protein
LKSLERTLDKIDLEAFSKAWLSDKSLLQIVREFNLSGTRKAKKIAVVVGLPERPEYKTKFDELKDQFIKLYNKGYSYSKIGKTLGIADLTAYAWRKKLNLAPRGKGGLAVKRYDAELKKLEECVLAKNVILLDDTSEYLFLSNQRILHLRRGSNIIDLFFLNLPTTSSIYKTFDFFGRYTGKIILYKKGDWLSLAEKLIEIIMAQKVHKGKEWQSALRQRLKNHPDIPQTYAEAIIDSISVLINDQFPLSRNTKVKSILNKAQNNLEKSSLIFDESKQHGKRKPYLLSVDDIMNLLTHSDKSVHKRLVSLILNLLDYKVLNSDPNTGVDLRCSKDSINVLVSIKGYQMPAYSDIIIVGSLAKMEKAAGLIVTCQKVPSELKNKSINDGVEIWDFDHLRGLLSGLLSLPSFESYVVIIKEGKFKGYYGIEVIGSYK